MIYINPPRSTEDLLADLRSNDPVIKTRAAANLGHAGDLRALDALLDAVDHPVRANDDYHSFYAAAYAALAHLIDTAGDAIAPEILTRLSGVADPSYDVTYYLENDDRYDAGHDFVLEDFSAIRAAAARALAARGV